MKKYLAALIFCLIITSPVSASVTETFLQQKADTEKSRIETVVARFRAWYQTEQASGGDPDNAVLPDTIFEGTMYQTAAVYENGILLLSVEDAVPAALISLLKSALPGQNIGNKFAVAIDKTGFNTGAAIDTSNFISRLTGGTFETGANLTFQGGNLIMDGTGRLNVKDIYVNGIKLSQLDNVNYTKGFALVNPSLTGTLRATNTGGPALYGTFKFNSNGGTFTLDETGFTTTGSLYAPYLSGPWGRLGISGSNNIEFTLNQVNDFRLNFYSGGLYHFRISDGNYDMSASGNIVMDGKSVTVDSEKDLTLRSGDDITVSADGPVAFSGSSVNFDGNATFNGDATFAGNTFQVDNLEALEVNIPSGGKLSFGDDKAVFRLNNSTSTLNIESDGKINFKSDVRINGKKVFTEGDYVMTDMEADISFSNSGISDALFRSNGSFRSQYGGLIGILGNFIIGNLNFVSKIGEYRRLQDFTDISALIQFRVTLKDFIANLPITGALGMLEDWDNYVLSRTTASAATGIQLYVPVPTNPDLKFWFVKKRIPFIEPSGDAGDHFYPEIDYSTTEDRIVVRTASPNYKYATDSLLNEREPYHYNGIYDKSTVNGDNVVPVLGTKEKANLIPISGNAKMRLPKYRLLPVVRSDGTPVYAKSTTSVVKNERLRFSRFSDKFILPLQRTVLSTNITDIADLYDRFGSDALIISPAATEIVYDGEYGEGNPFFLGNGGAYVPLYAVAYEVEYKDIVFVLQDYNLTVKQRRTYFDSDIKGISGYRSSRDYPHDSNQENIDSETTGIIYIPYNPVVHIADALPENSKSRQNFASPPDSVPVTSDILNVKLKAYKNGDLKEIIDKQYRINYTNLDIESVYTRQKVAELTVNSLTNISSLADRLSGDYYIFLADYYMGGTNTSRLTGNHDWATNSALCDLSIPKEVQFLLNNGQKHLYLHYMDTQPTSYSYKTTTVFNANISVTMEERLKFLGLYPSKTIRILDKVIDMETGQEVFETTIKTSFFRQNVFTNDAQYEYDKWYLDVGLSFADPTVWDRKFLSIRYSPARAIKTRGYLLPLAFFTRDE